MRIVSLLPACTEWVSLFGGRGEIVGRSHACDYPGEILELPALTQARIEVGDTQAVGKNIRSIAQRGISPFEVDLDRLVSLRPDVILTQSQCRVCAVSEIDLAAALADLTQPVPRLFSLHPHTMKEVLNQALALGRFVGRAAQAMETIAGLEKRLHLLQRRLNIERASPSADAPSVAALEWIEPTMTAGHWTPELIEMGGGRPVCATAGERSRMLSWDALVDEDPDVIAVMPCQLSVEAARENIHHLTGRETWCALRAVRHGRVFLFDGTAYFNRPGPRLYRSIELLAAALHGDRAEIEAGATEFAPL